MQSVDMLVQNRGLSRDWAQAIMEQCRVWSWWNHARLWLPRGHLVQVITCLSRISGLSHDWILSRESTTWSSVGVGGDNLLVLCPIVIHGHIDRRIETAVRIHLKPAEGAGRIVALPRVLMTVLTVLAVTVTDSDSLNLSRSGGLLSLGRACKGQCSCYCKAGC
jgi:hypothetical protein